MKTTSLMLTMLLVLTCLVAPAFSDSGPVPLKLEGTVTDYDLKGHLALYEDKTGLETFEDIRSKPFQTIQQGAPSLGFTQSAYWIKLALENETHEQLPLVLEIANHYLDFIDVFVTSNRSSDVERYRAGARVPFGERMSQGRDPVLDLRFAPTEQKTIFIRVRSDTPLRVPLILSTPNAYQRAQTKNYLFLGLFFGALIFLIIYNLFAWSILKQKAYLYYMLTILSVFVHQLCLTGLVPRVTLFSHPEGLLHLLNSAVGFIFIFNILFVSSFMDARAKYPILYRVLDAFLIFAVADTVLFMANFYVGNRITMIYGTTLAWTFPIVIGLMWYWGESHARYLFLAHVQFPILGTMFVGLMTGFIPFSFLLTHSLQLAYLLQGLFFSLALADRYSMIQGRFRHMLEDQVAERSAKLVAANMNLQHEMFKRRSVETAITKAKREWEETFDTVPDLIAIVDENHVIQRVNKAMAAKMNLHPRDAIGRRCYELCHGTTEPFAGCPLHQSLNDGKEHSAEVVEPRLGGAFLVSVTPMQTSDQHVQMFVHVARDISERKVLEERLRMLATTDSLTDIWNRRQFMRLTEREFDRIGRYGGELALIMLDLDHFKAINDTYGHGVGDEALKKVAEIGSSTLRKVDIFGRWGGEEFVIALPETGLERAVRVAERLRHHIAETPMTDDPQSLHITVSIGVTVAGAGPTDLQTMLKHADEALYKAKSNGRNRVEVSQQGSSTDLRSK